MRMLVIGGTRFIGPAVVRCLAAAGHQVTVFHRGESETQLPVGVEHVHGDRRRLADFAELRDRRPQVVLDMAPLTADDARSVMSAFRAVARRVVALSSQDVYRAYGRFHGTEAGPPEPVPLKEDAALRERLYPYRGSGRGLDDYEKVLVEREVMADAGLAGTVLRLPMVFGPGDYQHRLFFELKRMDDNRPAILLDEEVATWRWTRGYVEDVAHAVALAAGDDGAAGRVYNVGEEKALPYARWVEAIGKAAGWRGRVVALPRERLPAHLRPQGDDYAQHLVADTTRVRIELGYAETVPREEALRRTVAWERAHRPEGNPRWFDYAAEDAALAEAGLG